MSRKPSPVHIVVTCANRKRLTVPDRLHMRTLGHLTLGRRFTAWVKRLDGRDVSTVAAREMYAGEHWMLARDLADAVPFEASMWVCSAGYGLIPADAAIKPYAATFAHGMVDSVGATGVELEHWWAMLGEWPGPAPGMPRTFTALASREPNATIIAVLSDAYMRACAHDLTEAQSRLRDREQLSVIGPADTTATVADLLVPVTAALRPVVGGSLQALHVRAASMLLNACARHDYRPTRSALQKLAAQAAADAPEDTSRRVGGQRLTDGQVRDYIRKHLADPRASATRLLRQLRQGGQSCEQHRFKALFDEEQHHQGAA